MHPYVKTPADFKQAFRKARHRNKHTGPKRNHTHAAGQILCCPTHLLQQTSQLQGCFANMHHLRFRPRILFSSQLEWLYYDLSTTLTPPQLSLFLNLSKSKNPFLSDRNCIRKCLKFCPVQAGTQIPSFVSSFEINKSFLPLQHHYENFYFNKKWSNNIKKQFFPPISQIRLFIFF